MNYTKPEIVPCGSANAAIQGTSQSKGRVGADLYTMPVGFPNATIGAYEADE
ncbi:MAG: hypothetical protein LAO30_17940 [Acidobacteriia bacterium]|jgi:hypothetical protein|nr:hypothetical protein [Terriglobia bacterium]